MQEVVDRRSFLKISTTLGLTALGAKIFPVGIARAQGTGADRGRGAEVNADKVELVIKLEESGIILKNIPENGAEPRRVAGVGEFEESINTTGKGTEAILAEPGVVGRYDFYEDKENPSSVHLTGRNERTYTDLEVGPQAAALPANGFTELTAAYVDLAVGDQMLHLPDQGPDHSYVVTVQGADGDNLQDTDDSDTLEIRNYKPGHTSVKELGVPLGCGSFRSENDTLDAVVAAHGKSQTSKGDGGTSKVTMVLWTPQEKTLTITQSHLSTDDPKNIAVNDLHDWKVQFQNWQ